MVNSTLALNETLLQYSDVSSTKYRLDIYYSEVARENIPLTVIEGNSESFLNELQKVGISPSDYPAMKEFLQKVESL